MKNFSDAEAHEYLSAPCDKCGHPRYLHLHGRKALFGWRTLKDSKCTSYRCGCPEFFSEEKHSLKRRR